MKSDREYSLARAGGQDPSQEEGEQQKGQEIVGGKPGRPDTPPGPKSLCRWLLGGPRPSSWDWGRLPSLLGEDHGSTVPASPHLTWVLAPLQPGPEGRQEEEVPFTAQDSRSCVLIFYFSLLIPQKFLINSVALPGRRAHLWSYQGRKATWPASSGFSPLHAQLGGQALHQPGTAGGGCQGLGQLRASCFTQKIMG